jgi:SAM-dependent methyltransferase
MAPTSARASLLFPWQFMAIALSYLPSTILSALLALDLRTLLSWSRLQSAWFGRFWAHVGPLVRINAEKNVVPLLRGHVSHGTLLEIENEKAQPPHPPISGTLLELGPGSGMWTSLFSPTSPVLSAPNAQPLTKIYGIEPNSTIHPHLRQQIDAANLTSTNEIIPLGVQDLKHSDLVAPQSIDCIVTVMCLCSIPNPRENIAELYGYLKPGGRWYVYEHVKCHAWQGRWMGMYQGSFLLFTYLAMNF